MISRIKEEWPQILENIKKIYGISTVSFETWFTRIEPYAVYNNTLFLLIINISDNADTDDTGNKYMNFMEKKNYKNYIKDTVSKYFDTDFDIRFILPSQKEEVDNLGVSEDNNFFYNDKFDKLLKEAGLNHKYTFDTFVVGDNNKFAQKAALTVAENPAEAFNPFFIYGGVGLGKTHLLQSIGNYILKQDSTKKVMYVTSETFTNELIESIKNDKTNTNQKFRDKYRNVDVLLIDDIQFIAGKESTQEEFFHTFNALKESKKQIVISSDRHPKNIATLEDRLRSRFEGGLTTDIAPPTYETRMAILHKKAELEHLNISNDILEYIAKNITSNIRELEGSLTKVTAFSKLTRSDLTMELAEEALKDIISPNESRNITPELIMEIVADHFNISTDGIKSHKRNKELTYPRHIVMYLCRTMLDISLDTVGKIIGNRDHSTVINGSNNIDKLIKEDAATKELIDTLIKKINPA